QVRSLLVPLLGALEHAHARDVRHLDLRPGNVFVGADAGSVQIADFGFACALGAGRLAAATFHPQALERELAQEIELFAAPEQDEHTSELQSPYDLVCRLLLEKKK